EPAFRSEAVIPNSGAQNVEGRSVCDDNLPTLVAPPIQKDVSSNCHSQKNDRDQTRSSEDQFHHRYLSTEILRGRTEVQSSHEDASRARAEAVGPRLAR